VIVREPQVEDPCVECGVVSGSIRLYPLFVFIIWLSLPCLIYFCCEPKVEDPCCVECTVKPIGTTVKKASKKVVETFILYGAVMP
jgi:hypothetical protein